MADLIEVLSKDLKLSVGAHAKLAEATERLLGLPAWERAAAVNAAVSAFSRGGDQKLAGALLVWDEGIQSGDVEVTASEPYLARGLEDSGRIGMKEFEAKAAASDPKHAAAEAWLKAGEARQARIADLRTKAGGTGEDARKAQVELAMVSDEARPGERSKPYDRKAFETELAEIAKPRPEDLE